MLTINSTTPSVTILMPVHNGQEYLKEAIDSILTQTLGAFTFLIIDDASTDETPSILAQYAARDSRIQLITNEINLGLTACLNKGIHQIETPYIARMDADDISFPSRLLRQLTYMERNQDIAVVGSGVEIFNSLGTKQHVWFPPDNALQMSTSLLHYGAGIPHPTAFMRTNILKNVCGYRTNFQTAQDLDLWLRLLETSKITALPDILLKYRHHDMAISEQQKQAQAISHILAMIAAEYRRSGQPDPIEGKILSQQLLENLLQPGTPSALAWVNKAIWLNLDIDTQSLLRAMQFAYCAHDVNFILANQRPLWRHLRKTNHAILEEVAALISASQHQPKPWLFPMQNLLEDWRGETRAIPALNQYNINNTLVLQDGITHMTKQHSERFDISIVVPVYNAEKYLPRCLDSLLQQDKDAIEVIVVNDNSTGNCDEIVARYSVGRNNIKYIKHDTNRSLFQARISGVRAATGKYVMHVDADDWISKTTCSALFAAAEKYDADIVQYPIHRGVTIETMTPMWCNREELFPRTDKQILNEFLDGSIWWTICGKFFSRKIFVEALKIVGISEDIYINHTEDMALFLLLALKAQKYINWNHQAKYFYYDNPESLTKSVCDNDKSWHKFCQDISQVYKLTHRVMHKIEASPYEINALEKCMNKTLNWAIEQVQLADSSRQPRLILTLLQSYEQIPVVSALENVFPLLCSAVAGASVIKKSVKHIGIFSSMLRFGGAERVACHLATLFYAANYNITFFTTEPEQLEDYPYDRNAIHRVCLSDKKDERWKQIQNLTKEYNIDLVIFNDHMQEQMFYDILSVRLAGVKSLVIEHNTFFYPLYQKQFYLFTSRQAAYQAIDALVCLSPTDKQWWNSAGIANAIYIPNPTLTQSNEKLHHNEISKNILFIGRLCHHKGADKALFVLQQVLKVIPDAHLILCGRFESKEFEYYFTKLCQHLNLEKFVTITGHVTNPSDYFAQAAVHILPSLAEGFPMVLMEAKANKIPSVLFSMPYLAAATEDQGCIMVGKDDISGMACALIKILQDPSYHHCLAQASYNSLERYTQESIVERWQSLFNQIMHHTTCETTTLTERDASKLLSIAMTELKCALETCVVNKNGQQDDFVQLPSYLFTAHTFLQRIFPKMSIRRKLAKKGVCLIKRAYRICLKD